MSKSIDHIPKPGENSFYVGVLQEALNRHGAALKVDNDFGPATRKAVSVFQKKVGLTGTGVPGKKTMNALGIEIGKLTVITTGSDIDEGTPQWYRRMFALCQPDPGYEAAVSSAVKLVRKGLPRYFDVAGRLGYVGAQRVLVSHIIGAIHYREASCSFLGVLHNGEKIIGSGLKTRIVPKGRGPFSSWEQAAVDAIQLNGARWSKILSGSTNIGEILYAMERFNGTGYLTGAGKAETSPYLWAMSNINDGMGLYTSDGKFNPNATTQKSCGAATILKEFYVLGEFQCTGVTSAPPIPLLDLSPNPVGKLTREVIADKIVELIQRDVDAKLRETHGKNRSPRIDEFNKRAKSYLGAPYCASGGWCAIDDACKSLGIKNPVPPTASSQDFRRASFVPPKYIRPEGSLGKKGDVGVLQSPSDSGKGHYTTLEKDQNAQSNFATVEYNTDAVTGGRDGDGAYPMTRSTVDRSKANSGKIFVCFTDIPQWILDYNLAAK